LFASSNLLAAGIIFSLIIVLFTNLLFFGRKNNSKPAAQITSSKQNEEPEVAELSGTDQKKIQAMKERAKDLSSTQRIIPKQALEKSKRELRTLLLERELVSAALTRLYEAEAAKEITKDEREIIGAKYREELKALDSKIVGLEAFIEVGDLETLRDQLLRLVSEKIDAIERRIERVKISATPLIKDRVEKTGQVDSNDLVKSEQEKPSVPDISDLLSSPSSLPGQSNLTKEPHPIAAVETTESVASSPQATKSPTKSRKQSNSDGQVEELQKELLEALDRLEKLDVET
jgi:archaellum component FlaC